MEGRFVRFNEAAQKMLGRGETDLQPSEWSSYYGLFQADGVTRMQPGESPLECAMRGETIAECEVFIRNEARPDGVWCRVTAGPIVDDEIRGGIVVFNDITEQKRAIESIEASENRLRAVLETAADAIVTIDNQGIVQSFNRAATEMFGYTDEEMIGQNVSMLMPGPHRERHDEYIARYRQTDEARIIGIGRELLGQRKDGATFPVHLSISEVDDLGLFTGILHDLTESKALQQEVVEISAKEQERIGEDLHDGLGQELTGLGLMADGLVEMLHAPAIIQALEAAGIPDVAERFGEIAASVRKARDHVRQLSRGLVPVPIDEGGFPEAIRRLATTIDEWNDVDCAAVVDDAVQIRDPAAAVHLYRIAQEAAGNALKHSGADTIRIVLRGDNGAGIVEVIDNGAGILLEGAKPAAGIGLRIMDHRARLIGAKLAIEPGADGGTVVRCVYHDVAPHE
jgi:PAS domain S-box-containing protein